ncbi:hypothetical protein [Coleofasciculus sp. G2-EDA-02]
MTVADEVQERDRLVKATRISTPIAQRPRERVILTESQKFCGGW